MVPISKSNNHVESAVLPNKNVTFRSRPGAVASRINSKYAESSCSRTARLLL